jgi:peptidoglycan/LPS O-acetylase OafA/YrhL
MSASSEPRQDLDSASSGSLGNSVALDQWRGLALVFVLVSHGFYFTERVHGIGRVGVNLFFFISGVLVFRSLAKSRTTKPLALAGGFWKRRMRRLYPALAAYVLVMLPLVFILRHRPEAWDRDAMTYVRGIPIALLYAVNYWDGKPMSLAHLWSLACEMQFYLLAPLIFLLGGKTTARRHLVWGLILMALVVWGFVGPLHDPAGRYKYHFEIAVWPMMLGFCCEYRKDLFQRMSSKWLPFIMGANMAALCALAVLLLLGLQMKMLVIAIGTFSFIPCFLAYLAGWQMGGPVGRALTWLGERTYSIYLWQQPFTICRYLPVILHPAGAVASTFVGALWFRLFERPSECVGKGLRQETAIFCQSLQ